MMKFIYLFSLLLITLSCKGQVADADTLRQLAAKETTAIVDVRTVKEFEEGHLQSSINMPSQSLGDSIGVLKQYENIIVICRSGGRSAKAKTKLEEEGFTNIYNGGGWKQLKEVLELKEHEIQHVE
ncbi:MAG: rhodanese-like domain-containing protein [Dysgonomonas sp.]